MTERAADRTRPTILFLVHSAAIGGGPKFLRTLGEFALREGYDVWAVADRDGPLLDDLDRCGARVVALPLSTLGGSVRSLPRLHRLFRRVRPTLIHLYGQPSGCLGALAARSAGIRRLVYTAAFPAFHADFDRWRRARNWVVERVTTRLTSTTVCVSRHDLEEFRRRHPLPSHRLRHIPICVEARFFDEPVDTRGARARLGVAADAMLVCFVGRLTDQKGVDVLLRAVPAIRASWPTAQVVITGDGPLKNALEALARRTGVAQAVTFTGSMSDALAVFRAADVVVVPSRFEPLGLVAAEALAVGKPVVASRVGGLPEIVEHEETGILVPPDDPQALAAAVCRILGDAGFTARAGARGRAAIRLSFTASGVLAQYGRLYREMLAGC